MRRAASRRRFDAPSGSTPKRSCGESTRTLLPRTPETVDRPTEAVLIANSLKVDADALTVENITKTLGIQPTQELSGTFEFDLSTIPEDKRAQSLSVALPGVQIEVSAHLPLSQWKHSKTVFTD